jgi:hypothetical protein
VLAKWKSLPVAEKTTRPTSASQRMESSSAFLNSPRRLLEKVTCLAARLSILRIAIRSLFPAIVPLLLSSTGGGAAAAAAANNQNKTRKRWSG